MIIKAYASVTSEKIHPNSARKLFWEIGAKKYTEMVRMLAHRSKEQTKPFEPLAGMTEDELKVWVSVKNPSTNKE